jgi:hypothetical protein
MVELSPKDSSILTRITKHRAIPKEERSDLLKNASPKAKEIGEIILGTSTGEKADAEIKAAAEAYLKSFQPKMKPARSRARREKGDNS